jgi:adenylate cyclase
MSSPARSRLRERVRRGLAVGLVSFVLGFAVYESKIARPWEWKSWDLRLKLLTEPSRASRDIVIFLVDQYSLDVYEKQQGLTWPWPRQLYSAVLDYLHAGGAKAVFVDLLFTESSRSGVEDDQDFARAMARSGNVFLPLSLSLNEESLTEVPVSRFERFSIPAPAGRRAIFPSAKSATLPVEALLKAARGAGNVLFTPDGDGIFRRLPMAVSYEGVLVPSAPLVLAESLRGGLSLRDIPLDGSGQAIIRYHGGTGTYKTYKIAAIVNSWAQMEQGSAPQIPASEFAGKTVLIGLSAPGLLDLRPTPLGSVYPGVEIQATVLDNILRHDFIRAQPIWSFLALLLLVSLLTTVGASVLRRVWHQALFFLLCSALPLGAAWAGFRLGWWLELVVPEMAVVGGFIGAALLNYGVEGKQRRFIKGVFRHYLSPDVIERIIENPHLLRLGGEKREITSFFSDVAGFTSISEKLSPEELVGLLNEYLSEMTDIILSNGGTLDKYEGDAIIAFWNAPLDQADHALRACRAAVECQRRLAELRPRWTGKIGGPLAMRIGLNSGPAVVGNMGSSRRFDYTAMGDTVNLASRLEGACKLYGVPILIGEETHAKVKGDMAARLVDRVRVVGKKLSVSIYEVIGEESGLAALDAEKLQKFERARAAFERREWAEAAQAFAAIEGDGPAALYLDRCRILKESPPPADWDGVFDLKQK